jgi:DNA-binding transcriptional regulator YiaG
LRTRTTHKELRQVISPLATEDNKKNYGKRQQMTPQEFKQLRKRVFTTQEKCAEWIHYDTRQVKRWEAGHAPIPWIVQKLIIALDDGVIDKEG